MTKGADKTPGKTVIHAQPEAQGKAKTAAAKPAGTKPAGASGKIGQAAIPGGGKKK